MKTKKVLPCNDPKNWTCQVCGQINLSAPGTDWAKKHCKPHHTPTPCINVTWDGKGLNDKNNIYRERIATFSPQYLQYGKFIERTVNCHSDLIHGCYMAIAQLVNDAEESPENVVEFLRDIIAKAEGK